jgi:hypothetical protein
MPTLVENERTPGLRPVRLSPADMDLPSHAWRRLPSSARRRSRAAAPAPGADVPLTYPYPSEAPRPDFSRYPAERPIFGHSAGGIPLIRVYVLSPAKTQAWVQVASWLHTWHKRCSTALTNGEGRDVWARWPWAGHGEARHLAPTAVTKCRHLSTILVDDNQLCEMGRESIHSRRRRTARTGPWHYGPTRLSSGGWWSSTRWRGSSDHPRIIRHRFWRRCWSAICSRLGQR